MKSKILFLFLLGILVSCSDNENQNEELVGKWKLTETLVDPGDGSGTFQPVNSNKTIQFNSDGTLNSNSYLCNMFSIANEASSGKFNITEHTIFSLSCNPQLTLNYRIENNELIIDYSCFEGCAEKYIKIN